MQHARRITAVLLALVAITTTAGPALADTVYFNCGYDPATGTVYEEWVHNGWLKGGPASWYDRNDDDSGGCAPALGGAYEQVVFTNSATSQYPKRLQIMVPWDFVGRGTPEDDGISEIEFAVTAGLPFTLELWGRRTGGDFFDIAANGDIRFTTDADVDITVAPGAVTDWVITGGEGNDLIRSALGAGNTLFVGAGKDNDDIVTGASADIIQGHGGNDVIYSGEGNDELHGFGGVDVIRGDGGNDTIYGERGKDEIYGGSGDDTIYAADGIRYYDGSPLLTNDVVHCGTGYDVVASWTVGDIIDSDCEVIA